MTFSKPATIASIGDELAIAWEDGSEQYLSLRILREACPYALCQGEPDVIDFSQHSTADAKEGVAPVLASSSTSLYTPGLRSGGPSPSSPAASFERSLIGNALRREPSLRPESFVLKKYEFVGGYGVQFFWGDGHSTGIYSLGYLRALDKNS